MRRVLSLIFALLLGFAAAEQQPGTAAAIELHASALRNLGQSLERLAAGGEGSDAALDAAAADFRQLGRSASPSLTAGMERAFSRARTAVANSSETDLAVQVGMLTGGFQRLLLDQALAGADLEDARPAVARLAADLGLEVDVLSAIQEAADVRQLVGGYRAAVAARIAERLRQAAGEADSGATNEAYRTFAGAYGLSLSLQDAEGAPADLNGRFAALIEPVTAGDTDAFAAGARELAGGLDTLSRTVTERLARTEITAEPAGNGAPASEPAAPAEPEEPEPAEAEPGAAGPEEAEADGSPAEDETPADVTPAVPADGQAAPPAAPAADEGGVADESASAAAGLAAQFRVLGLERTAAQELAERLGDSGARDLGGVWAPALALGSQAAAAAARGDQEGAAERLAELRTVHDRDLAPLMAAAFPEHGAAMRDLLDSFATAPALHAPDLMVLNDELVAMSENRHFRPVSAELQSATVTWFGGWPRLLLRVITGLLAFLPLWYLKLAFGGSNRNWSLVSSGLFLLLLPVILGGIAALLDMAGALAGLPSLHGIAAWLVPAGVLQQTVQQILTVLAVLLLSVGLFGICRQFGLFGGVRAAAAAADSPEASAALDSTLVDWESEL